MGKKDKTKATTPRNSDGLTLDSAFKFSCYPGISCFGTCCRDVTIFLTPHDVIRMKNRLKINSWDFIDRYTAVFYKGDNPFPFVRLQMEDTDQKECSFVDPVTGCSIYEDRPWSCRMYPLDMSEGDTYKIIVSADKCKGLLEQREWLISEWLENQGIAQFDELDHLYSQLTSHQAIHEKSIDNPQVSEMVFMATYDLDRFRRFVFESKFLQMFDLPEEHIALLKTDDKELLKLGFKWLGFGLINPLSIRIKTDVVESFLKENEEKQND
ncbi:YkgJ family cysteine cluster protein [candidate division CSSED10-310 bacterium]|uniref:YkgJ family cysteine cluster protein n=1 Tax=candidate division CSSED10-310 bacterium TaxID=2855610 RepID=A0ABV6Z424_UNCC1